MKLNRVAPWVLGGLVWCLVLPAAHAGEMTPAEVLKKVAKGQYLPKENGLKSIIFDMESPMLAMMGDVKMTYKWKAPNHEKCIFSGPENPMMPKKQMESQIARTGATVVGQSYADLYKDYAMSMEMDGANYKIVGKTDDKEQPTPEFTLLVSPEFRPLKMKTKVSQMGMTMEQEATFTLKEHKGKYYLSEIKSSAMGQSQTVKYDYADVNGIFLPSGLTVTGGMMGEMKITFANMKVNTDIPDSEFPVQN